MIDSYLFACLCFSVRTYSHIRKDVNTTVGYKCIPEYRHLLKAKPDLRPPGIVISEKGDDAQCPMKNILEHTVKRLCKATGNKVHVVQTLGTPILALAIIVSSWFSATF